MEVVCGGVLNDFLELGRKHGTDKVLHHGYQFFYPRFLEPLRSENFTMLEIGYDTGASVRMWEEYFPKAEIFAADIRTSGRFGRHEVIEADQSSAEDLDRIVHRVGSARFILDDGSHQPEHQFETFNFLFRRLLEPGGIYIIEDIECSYWNPESSLYGYRVGFFNVLDATSKLIDLINEEFTQKRNDLCVGSITYGQNCVIITKQTDDERRYFDRPYRFSDAIRSPAQLGVTVCADGGEQNSNLLSETGFNVCLPQPPGYQHSFCLLELAELIVLTLRELGHETHFLLDEFEPTRRNIIVGCHLADPSWISRIPKSSIVVNTEQIYDQLHSAWKDNIFQWVKNFEAWDYSVRNISVFNESGIPNVKLLRIGHQAELTRIVPETAPDIDVLFYGSVTDRRAKIFDEIRNRGLNLVNLFGVYGAERDNYIARSKIVLNLHNHPTEIFEVVRVHYLLSNAVAVVSEINASTSGCDFYADAVAGVPYESLAAECERLVRDDSARAAQSRRGYEVISCYPQTEFLKTLIR